ncbi:pantoate--beta-alanine ligase [Pontiella sulfatireligans]|uniref:Pantothenate synthetase n=1 Tax=Pontiella sulfatireligans TaxID=2750658 RepID=A0A6C2UT03_9BACT|nr:Pantothenate synthetase [Pontiella sulfatireligans]
MDIIKSPEAMQCRVLELKRAGYSIGFVPTMGFLHEGHLSLMRLARSTCDVLVASIFVNPIQFGPNEDLGAYPRDFERDETLCEQEGVDIVFYPDPVGMYAADASVWVDEDTLSRVLCGASRPGHFRGVCTVVAKLFNLVLPDVAVFGEKDAQQLRIIERMVRDLNFPVKIVRGPIVREADGLAMSSRNKHLSESQRKDALCLRRSLDIAQQLAESGELSVGQIRLRMVELIEKVPEAEMDYISFVDDATLEAVDQLVHPVLIALAVKFGSTRLIDNRVVVL